jgi:hypothetical protein
LCFSQNSLISIFISASFESNNSFAKIFTVSVFQTQVGHNNKNDQTGLFGDDTHALFLKIVLEIFSKISSCQIMFFHNLFHNLMNFLFSSCEDFKELIQVARATASNTSCFQIVGILDFSTL